MKKDGTPWRQSPCQPMAQITLWLYRSGRGICGEGKRMLPNAANHLASAWLKYTFAIPVLEGLGVGAGSQHVGKRNTFTADFVLPGYTTFDAAISYRIKGINLALNVN